MKRLSLFSAALAVYAACMADTSVSFLSTTHNFGAFAEDDGPVSCRFPIVNTGNDDLVILSVRASCGCTQPKYDRNPIHPGDTTFVDVTYDPSYRPGRFEKSISVETNTNPAKTRLTISGTVIGGNSTIASRYPADFGPLKVEYADVNLGDAVAGAFVSSHVRIYNQSADSLFITAVPQACFIDTEVAPNPLPPGEQGILLVSFNSLNQGFYGFQESTIDVAADSLAPRPLNVSVNILEDFSRLSDSDRAKAPVATLDTEKHDLGVIISSHKLISRNINLSNSGQRPLEIRRIYSMDPGVTIGEYPTTLKPGHAAEISVEILPKLQKGGMVNAKVIVITNDPENPVRTVRLVGEFPSIQRVQPN